MEKRVGQKDGELPIEYLRRVVSNCNYEAESLLQGLPSVEAILDYFELWHVYGTDFMQGIEECIQEGDNPAPLLAFIKKYKLDWNTSWIKVAP